MMQVEWNAETHKFTITEVTIMEWAVLAECLSTAVNADPSPYLLDAEITDPQTMLDRLCSATDQTRSARESTVHYDPPTNPPTNPDPMMADPWKSYEAGTSACRCPNCEWTGRTRSARESTVHYKPEWDQEISPHHE